MYASINYTMETWYTYTCVYMLIFGKKASGTGSPNDTLQFRVQWSRWNGLHHTDDIFKLFFVKMFIFGFSFYHFKLNLVIRGWGIYWGIILGWWSLDLTDDKAILVLVMTWCRQCWPSSMSPYGAIMPQWVNWSFNRRYAENQKSSAKCRPFC